MDRILTFDYDIVIFDTGNNTEDSTIYPLTVSDDVLMIITLEISTLDDVYELLTSLRLLNLPTEHIKLVVNKMPQSGNMIDLGEIMSILQAEVIATIPNEPAVKTWNNRGEPAVITEKNEFQQAIQELARIYASPGIRLVTAQPAREKKEKKKRFWFGRERRKKRG